MCLPYHELLDPNVPTRNEATQRWALSYSRKRAWERRQVCFVPRRPEKFSAWALHFKAKLGNAPRPLFHALDLLMRRVLPNNGESRWGSWNHMQISQLQVKLLTRFSVKTGRQLKAKILCLQYLISVSKTWFFSQQFEYNFALKCQALNRLYSDPVNVTCFLFAAMFWRSLSQRVWLAIMYSAVRLWQLFHGMQRVEVSTELHGRRLPNDVSR